MVRDLIKSGHNHVGYPLAPGNVIKLGRVEYMVIEAKNEDETKTLRDTQHFEETNGIFELAKQIKNLSAESAENNCKVCLVND